GVFWLLPVARAAWRPLGARATRAGGPLARALPYLYGQGDLSVHLLTILTPPVALGLMNLLWAPGRPLLSLFCMGASGLLGVVGRLLSRRHAVLAYTHALMALLLMTLALAIMLQGGALLITLAAEAAT